MSDDNSFGIFVRRYGDVECSEIGLLSLSDDELIRMSHDFGVGLTLSEMIMVRNYFASIGRNPTDVELQAIGQAWSEHCSYKSSKKILRKTVFGIKAPQNISVISEDAGVVEFDQDHAYVVAFESHNHPSAVEPYGGAATGVGGILRDVVCMGAQPIGVLDPLFFAPPDYTFRKKLPDFLKSPRFIFSGVVSGIRDYGNQVGIPNLGGMVFFDDSYVANPIVNVACVGFMRKDELIHSFAGAAGDLFVMLGGRTGRDGIHGVNFASIEIGSCSESDVRSAVQVGQPIIKEPLIHVCLEANRRGLLSGMKDLGGGGLSCVVGEMAQPAGLGAHINLERVLLKEKGMAPWEIWVSESQERMMVTIRPENLSALIELCNVWDVEAAVVGEATNTKRLVIDYNGKNVFDMDIDFLVDAPLYDRQYEVPAVDRREPDVLEPGDYNAALLSVLSSLNCASKESIIRVYDHEVMAKTVVRPLSGQIDRSTHNDASVFRPLDGLSDGSYRGLAFTCDVNPLMCRMDPYNGAMSAIDEACRNLACVGARAHSFADCLNFGNPEKPERLGEFYECARGLGDGARAIGVPFVSGNVSLYNEGVNGSICPTPVVFAVGIVDDIRNTCTSELKCAGNKLYLVGSTFVELGGSEYYQVLGVSGGAVPQSDSSMLKRTCDAIVTAIERGAVASCHDVSGGGIGVCVAEMVIGSAGLGARIDLSLVCSGNDANGMRPDHKMFSESNTRFVVESRDSDMFTEYMKSIGVPVFELGRVTADGRFAVNDRGRQLVDLKVTDLAFAWDGGLFRA